MPADAYFKGQLVRTTATYTDKTTGQVVAPSGVTCKVKKPDATTTTFTGGQLQNPSTGIYYLDIDGNQIGVWWVQWTSTGVNQAATETSFEIRTSQF